MRDKPVFHKSTINSDPRVEKWLSGDHPEREAAAAEHPNTEEEIKEYIIHHKRSIEEMIFWEDNVAWLQNYLPVRKEYIERSIDKSIKRSYAFLDVVDSFIRRAVEENCMQLRAWLVEYKSRQFDDTFIDAADSDQVDLEFELREPFPAESQSAGTEITLGRYRYEEDGAAGDIVWQVLDVIEDRALIVSRSVLDFLTFNDEWGRTTWEECSLRRWLNEEFLQEAFTDEERGRILCTRIRNRNNDIFGTEAGPDTEDRVFILSMDEAREFYALDEERTAFATPYAKAKSAGYSTGEHVPWRLRTPGYKGGCYNACIHKDGMINTHGCFNDQAGFGIRPAMWIRL